MADFGGDMGSGGSGGPGGPGFGGRGGPEFGGRGGPGFGSRGGPEFGGRGGPGFGGRGGPEFGGHGGHPGFGGHGGPPGFGGHGAPPGSGGPEGPGFDCSGGPGFFGPPGRGFIRFGGGPFYMGRSIVGGVFSFLYRNRKWVMAAVVVYGAVKIVKHFQRKKLRAKWDAAGKDVVVLHTIKRGHTCPSLTPFAVKLETFFRMMDIKYELDVSVPMGPKHKVPWITMNGKDYTDSELIVQTLQTHFNKFPDANVPSEERAAGLALQVMMEEHLYWGLVSWRYVEDKQRAVLRLIDFPPCVPGWLLKIYSKRLKKMLYYQGLGRHSIPELHSIMKRDLEALSSYLGTKQFIYGDEPHVTDCAIFGMLTQFIYNSPGSPYLEWINNDFKNLKEYSDRIKAKFWPDWNQCVLSPDLVL